MKHKMFKDAEIKTTYVTTNYLPLKVPYKVFNGQIIIDLKRVIDGVLDDQEIGKYDTKKIDLSIPFSLDKEVTGNSMTVIINKHRYQLRLKNLEVIPSKQQKIDFDNTHPHRWLIPQWLKFIESLFYDHYGFQAIDLNLRGKKGQVKRGRVFGLIKSLKKKILECKTLDTNHESIVEYLRWVFETKADKVSLTLPLICCDNMVQDWIVKKRKEGKTSKRTVDGKKKKRKWD